MDGFTLRAATQADAPLIHGLLREFAVYLAERAGEKPSGRFSLDAAAAARDMLGAACFTDLAFLGKEPVGLAAWYWTYKSFRAARGLFVEDLYVRPAFRGRGFGRALLAHLAARAKDADGFLEWQVLDVNADAIAFYERLGARTGREWRNFRLESEALERLAQA